MTDKGDEHDNDRGLLDQGSSLNSDNFDIGDHEVQYGSLHSLKGIQSPADIESSVGVASAAIGLGDGKLTMEILEEGNTLISQNLRGERPTGDKVPTAKSNNHDSNMDGRDIDHKDFGEIKSIITPRHVFSPVDHYYGAATVSLSSSSDSVEGMNRFISDMQGQNENAELDLNYSVNGRFDGHTAFEKDDAPSHGMSSSTQFSGLASLDEKLQSNEHEQFFQVSLQESQYEEITTPIKSSLLQRITFGSYAHDEEHESPTKYQDKKDSNVENIDGNSGSRKNSTSHIEGLTSESSTSPKSDSFSSRLISSLNTSSFSSPLGSPLLFKGKAMLPNASAELMHLIDSAIQGSDPVSMERLRSVVAEEDQLVDEEGSTYNTSKLVVDILLAKMGAPDSQNDEKAEGSPRMMLSVGAALVAGKLIPWLPSRDFSRKEPSPRTRVVNGLTFILKSCTRNRSMCSSAGLLQVLILAAQKIFAGNDHMHMGLLSVGNWDVNPLLELLTILGSHCLSGQDLRCWLQAISDTIPQGRSLSLILPLERALVGEETKGPSHTFEFDGESSGLLGPGESRWPFVNGYAFATWLYVESFADTVHAATTAAAIAAAAVAKAGKSSAMSAAAAASALAGEGTAHMPRLFSFLSADNQGLEAYFHSQFLVVESASTKGKKASLHFTYDFKPRRWYFIGIEHICRQSILGKTESEVKLYVDGHLCDSRPFEFPRVTKPLAFCCIGTNPPPIMAGLQRRRRLCPLFAEMGPVYIFKEPIGGDRMARLAARGGDAVPTFGNGAGSPSYSSYKMRMMAAEESLVLDMELESSLHLLYHPKLLVGRSCPDASPSGAAGTHRRPAEILGHVHVASRMRPVETIWATGEGGPLSLLPLAIGGADKDTMEPTVENFQISTRASVLAAPILRIISLSLEYPGNAEVLRRGHTSQLLAQILAYLLSVPKSENDPSITDNSDVKNEELVAAVMMLAQAPKFNDDLKVQLFSYLLLDLKLWCRCSYGLQKKLLSSLADMVFTESATMRAANAVQMLLDGCRKCYWIVPESDSLHLFADGKLPRSVGELNALVDELLVIVELLLGTAQGAVSTDVQVLVKFLLHCPQPNQVARVLHLLYRLVVQPNTSRAAVFAENFLHYGGIEMLLTLLQLEHDSGENPHYMPYLEKENNEKEGHEETNRNGVNLSFGVREVHSDSNVNEYPVSVVDPVQERLSVGSETVDLGGRLSGLMGKTLAGIGLSITSDSAKNNFRNIDSGDGIIVAIIGLLGALISGGHLKLTSMTSLLWSVNAPSMPSTVVLGEYVPDTDIDASVWLLYALQKSFQAAPSRLLTDSVYEALLAVVIRSEVASLSSGDHLNLYDSSHCFEHTQLLAVLFRVLPVASKKLQIRALQDILFLASIHAENRLILIAMPEWPEWLLEILISNYEFMKTEASKLVEDLVYNFLMIILEHSMRQKDGWKDVESTIHCAEWLAIIGGSSTGEQRHRREETLPIIKRKVLAGLLDFAAAELRLQTQVVAAAAAGVVAGGLSPSAAKAEADSAAYMSMSLAENSIVLLMLVEDHLRLQCVLFNPSLSSAPVSGPASPRAFMPTPSLLGLSRTSSDGVESMGSRRFSTANDSGGLSLNILASMADANGQISAVAMERLTAAAAAEPYESVRCAFVSYGSCAVDLAAGWKKRSRLWYGVGIPTKGIAFGGGGSGWDSWNSVIEKDENGDWIELPLLEKSIAMLQSLLVDASGVAAGSGMYGYGGGAGAGTSGMHILQQLLDSDQPFFTMLRMVLVSMREEDKGIGNSMSKVERIGSDLENISSKLSRVDSFSSVPVYIAAMQNTGTKASLLWCVLAPLLTMPLTESRRQRVLVAACIMYSEVWHAVSADKKLLRKSYLEMIVTPFAALLRRWRPLLSGMHELTDADGQNPLQIEDRSLAVDAHPLEAAAAMVTPEWAAAFASPPAAMALAMAAAGAGGGDLSASKGSQQKRDFSSLERKPSRLRNFATFQKLSESSTPPPKDKASAKAAALAAARDQERAAKIGSGRGLGAVAMASSAQRRFTSDRDRAKRWGIFESMHTAWIECCAMPPGSGHDIRDKEGNVASLRLFLSLSEMMEAARSLQQIEARRCMVLFATEENEKMVGIRAWRQLLRSLLEIGALFGLIATKILSNQKIFWKLDPIENSMRMRRRLKRNYKGTEHYGAAVDYLDSHSYSESNGSPSIIRDESDAKVIGARIPAAEAVKLLPEHIVFEEPVDEEALHSDAADFEDRREDRDYRLSISSKQSSDDHAPSMRPSTVPISTLSGISQVGVVEPHEKLLLEIPAIMVQPLKVSSGVFNVTNSRIYFVLDHDTAAQHLEGNVSDDDKQGRRKVWPLSVLCEIHSRRYLLRRSALELFLVDRSNYFFDFGNADGRKKAYKAILQARPPYLNNIYAGTQRPEQLLKRTRLTERWARWEISNFEYLMQLNTLAGRSYNDITQYPVFPWVLADYCSKNLELDNPVTFRDLSKPVGALNPSRLEKVLERYENFDDPIIPRFHYGSHYSSAGTVLYYLVRAEPFTTLSIQLQGGKFDHADRMFGDIGATWNGVLEDMSDVKELVPELFYSPEILININDINLGRTQRGERIGDVKLPPWAKDPVDFIQKHREALESKHVSAQIHQWIDLIFGYKQRGKEAVAANNVFFYMTYEGAVDIDQITDPVIRKGTQDQIAYFGQTPSQLLTTPHIKRMPLEEVLHLQTIFRNPSTVQCFSVPIPERCNVPAGAIFTTSDSLVVVDVKSPACSVAVHKWQPHTPDGHGLPFHFQHGKPAPTSGRGAFSRMFNRQSAMGSDDWHYPRAVACIAPGVVSNRVIAITPDGYLLTGGHADNSLKLVAGESARTMETASGHSAPITCLGLSPDGSICITGSRDSTLMLWKVHNNSISNTEHGLKVSGSPVSSITDKLDVSIYTEMKRTIIEGPLHVLRGHVDDLTCCCVNADLDVAVSCSHGCGVLLHSVTRGRLIRCLPLQNVDAIALSSDGVLIIWDKTMHNLCTININGISIASRSLSPSDGDVTSIVVSVDGQYAVVGTSCTKHQQPDTSWYAQNDTSEVPLGKSTEEGIPSTGNSHPDDNSINKTGKDEASPAIIMFNVHTLEVLHKIKLQPGQDITALTLNSDSTNLVVSTADGQLLVYTDPTLSIKMVDRMLRLGWQGAGLAVHIS